MGKIATTASFVFILMLTVSCAATIPDALVMCKDKPRYSIARMSRCRSAGIYGQDCRGLC